MGKINWTRVLIGGLVAGLAINVFQLVGWALFVRRGLSAALDALGQPLQETVGTSALLVVLGFAAGMLLIWLYAAICPRYGAGPGTAALAGVAAGVLLVIPNIGWGSMIRAIPAGVWAIDAADTLVISVVATLLGAWVYKEQGP